MDIYLNLLSILRRGFECGILVPFSSSMEWRPFVLVDSYRSDLWYEEEVKSEAWKMGGYFQYRFYTSYFLGFGFIYEREKLSHLEKNDIYKRNYFSSYVGFDVVSLSSFKISLAPEFSLKIYESEEIKTLANHKILNDRLEKRYSDYYLKANLFLSYSF